MGANEPLAPSAIPNVMTGRTVRDASQEEIEEAVAAFAAAARRAAEAGFDGVHIHGANGYLMSEFRSPLTNRRTDEWGGTQERRDAFAVAVVRAVREALPAELGLSMKVGFEDVVDETGGLSAEEATAGARRFVEAGLDAIEVSSNLMADYERASIPTHRPSGTATSSRGRARSSRPHATSSAATSRTSPSSKRSASTVTARCAS